MTFDLFGPFKHMLKQVYRCNLFKGPIEFHLSR